MTLQECSDERVTTPSPPSPPPIPLQTYLWEDVRREREKGGYPWTHFVKRPFDPNAPQEILEYDRSPGSKRKYGSLDVPELEESPGAVRRRRAASAGEALENETIINGDTKRRSKSVSIEEQVACTSSSKTTSEAPSSPRSILKNRPNIKIPSLIARDKDSDSPKDTECCHPFVDKLKTIADKNILKSPRAMKKLLKPSPKVIKKKDGSLQEIIPLEDSPLAEKKKREMEKIFEKCSPKSTPKKHDSKNYKDHIYESIEDLPSKSLKESVSEKELNAITKSLSDAEDIGKDIRDSDELIARDSLTRSLDQYLKEELMTVEDKAVMDSKNEILKDILKRIADENEAQAPLSKMDSEEEERGKLVKQMPVLEEDEENKSNAQKEDVKSNDKCLVIDITETIEEEIVDFVVMPDEDQDIDEIPESDEVIDIENKDLHETENVTAADRMEVEIEEETSDAKNRRSKFSDHEYESIGDPDSETGPKPTQNDPKINYSPPVPSIQNQLHSSSDHDEQIDSDKELTVAEMQQQIEDKYFNKTDEQPTLASIAIETPMEADTIETEKSISKRVGERRRDMQRKLQNQAGKLKTKIQGMKKTTFTKPKTTIDEEAKAKKARLGDDTTTESSEQTKTKLSPIRKITMNKISMPEFKMPERPKISMPQLKLPDKSKFKLPERPHLPDFKMPERPKMPDFKMPDFKMPDMPEFKMPNLKRHNSMKEPPTSSESTAESKKRIAFDFRTYPRIFSKKQNQDFATSSPKEERDIINSATVPRAAARKKGPVGARWVNRFTDIKFVDDGDNKRGDFEDRLHRLDEDYKQMQQEQEFEDNDKQISPDSFNESMASDEFSAQRNRYWAEDVDIDRRDFDYGVKVDSHDSPSSNQEERGSSGESYEKHRIGVLEEIDADEFFLRQRGISQDDIQVGKYLSSEIREAFRTPANALEQLGSYDEYDDRDLDMNDYSESRDVEEDIDMEVSLTPLKPERTRSLRKQKPQYDSFDQADDFNGFNTFPPNKPRRQKKSKKPVLDREISVYNVDVDVNDENDRNIINRDTLKSYERQLYENQMMEGKTQPEIMVVQDKLLNDINLGNYINEDLDLSNNTYENEENMKNLMMEQKEVPKVPKRKRKRSTRDVSASSEPGSIINAQFQDDWPSLSQLPVDIDDEVIVHRVQHEYVIPLAESEQFPSPTPPRRTRSRSLTSRATTAPDEDRTSHGAESLISDNHQWHDKEVERNVLDLQDGSGYAIIKRTPSVPKRKKRFSKSAEARPTYRTTPRMKEPPPRPPPRRQSVPDLRENSPDVTQYEEVEDEIQPAEDINFINVTNKMKDRPLPAPPRPPRAVKRKKKKNGKQDDIKVDDKISMRSSLERNMRYEHGSIDNIENEFLQRQLISNVAEEFVDNIIQKAESQVVQTIVGEQEMWTQTDPMVDDIICDAIIDQQDNIIIKDVWKEQPYDLTNFSTIERNRDDLKKLKDDSSRSSLDPSDVEKARKIADAESLSRGLRRFRESSRQRTFSSSRTPSERAASEHALLLERTLVTPTKAEECNQLIMQATLLVQPVEDELDIDDLLEQAEREEKRKLLHSNESVNRAQEFCKEERELKFSHVDNTEVITEQDLNASKELKKSDTHSVTEVADEPPVPVRRRGLEKSRSMTTQEETEQKSITVPEKSINIIENQTEPASAEVEILKTNRLKVSNLDVENLNVSQLQASSITVSEVDGIAMHVKELNSKSGNLVVSGIDIAPSVIQEMIDRLTPTNTHTTAQISTQTDETLEPTTEEKKEEVSDIQYSAPGVQFDPSLYFSQNPYMQQGLYYPNLASIPPASFYTLRPPDLSEEDVPQVQTVHKSSRRRHVPKKESTSEEEQQETFTRHRRVGTRSPEPTIQEITGQLVQACCSSVQRNARIVWNAVKSKTNTEERKREIQIALIILLVFTAGLIMIALSDNKTVHHHHWEFFNPPSDKNA